MAEEARTAPGPLWEERPLITLGPQKSLKCLRREVARIATKEFVQEGALRNRQGDADR